MQKITSWIDSVLANILIVLMSIMVIDVSWQVFTRFILRDPSSFTEELAIFLLIWIGVLGASYALRTRAHLGIDILTFRLRGVKKNVVEIIVYCCVFGFTLSVMVIGGLKLVLLTFNLNQISAAMGIKMGYIYLVIPLSGVLMMFYALVFIINAVKEWSGEHRKPEERLSVSID